MDDFGVYINDDVDGLRSCYVVMPWPVSVNAYWCHGAKGMVYLSKRGREYKQSIVSMFDGLDFKAMEKRIRLDVILEAPSVRRLDIDNFQKCIEDSLTSAGMWVDDSQVDLLAVCRGRVRKGGRAVVLVREIDVDDSYPPTRDDWTPNHWFYKQQK